MCQIKYEDVLALPEVNAVHLQKQPEKKVGRLYFTVGSTRAGKTTFANYWVNEAKDRVVVDTDTIRLAVTGKRYLGAIEPFIYYLETIVIKSFLLQGKDVLFCETNTSNRSIEKILNIDIDAVPIYIHSTREECIDRARKTGQDDLVDCGVIDRHFKNLDTLCGPNSYYMGLYFYGYYEPFKKPIVIIDQLNVEKGVNKIREFVRRRFAK